MVDFKGLKTGTIIDDRYVVESLIGTGGYSEVVAARDEHQQRPVAIKVLHPEATDNDPRAVERMRQEAEILRAIDHPKIVRIHDVGTFEGGDYLVMERVDGQGLDALLEQCGHLDTDEVRSMVEQLLDALRAAHDTEILHRDLKPENILIADDGTIKLVDFGVAKANRLLNAEDPEDGITLVKTRSGSFVGTPRYAAPEMVVGDPLSPSTDLFCVGLIVYEALTGQSLLTGNTQSELINQLVFPRPFDLDDLDDNWQKWLTPILEKNPEHRTVSVEQARRRLDEFDSSDRPLSSSPHHSSTSTPDHSGGDQYHPTFGETAPETRAEGPPSFGPDHSAADAATAGFGPPDQQATVEHPPPDFSEDLDDGPSNPDASDSGNRDPTEHRSDPPPDLSSHRGDSGADEPSKDDSPGSDGESPSTTSTVLWVLIVALLAFIIAGVALLGGTGG